MRIEMMTGGTSVTLDIILPEGWRKYRPEKGRVMWLLHDKFDTSSDWVSFTQAELFASMYGFALICPTMGNGRYNDGINTSQWQTYFDNLWDYVHDFLPILSKAPEDNLLFGFARGAFGAIKFALNHPERFGGVYTVSFDDGFLAGVRSGKAHSFPTGSGYGTPEEFAVSQDNLMWYAGQYAAGGNPLPKIHMSCMTGDKTYTRNLEVRDELSGYGYEVSFEAVDASGARLDDSSGGANGDWFFCNSQLEKALRHAAGK